MRSELFQLSSEIYAFKNPAFRERNANGGLYRSLLRGTLSRMLWNLPVCLLHANCLEWNFARRGIGSFPTWKLTLETWREALSLK